MDRFDAILATKFGGALDFNATICPGYARIDLIISNSYINNTLFRTSFDLFYTKIRATLQRYIDPDKFKLYLLDCGLLAAQMKMSAQVFLASDESGVFPVEVKAGVSRQSKSLKLFGKQFDSPSLVRTTARNYRKDGDIVNFPLYAISLLSSALSKK